MEWKDFIQAISCFLSIIGAIISFHMLGIDINFIITFILAIFTLSISIFFFTESNKIMGRINEGVIAIKKDVEQMKIDKRVKGLNISGSSFIRRGYKK